MRRGPGVHLGLHAVAVLGHGLHDVAEHVAAPVGRLARVARVAHEDLLLTTIMVHLSIPHS